MLRYKEAKLNTGEGGWGGGGRRPFPEDALTANTKLVRVREQNGSTGGSKF